MSQISKTPTGYKTYYKKFVESNKAKLAQAREKLEKDISYNKVLRQEIISNKGLKFDKAESVLTKVMRIADVKNKDFKPIKVDKAHDALV